MTYYGASYLPPNSSSATFDSSSFNRANEALTYQTALDNFLAYPTAQGTENLKTTNISGMLTLTNDLIINGDNYIQFPDGTQQNTAPNTSSFASVISSNTFLSPNQPSAPYQQIITGNSLSGNTNAPLVVKNIDTGEYFGWYIDPSTNYDATMYSAQTTGGLTIRNSGGNSFTMTPSMPNNTAVFSNPISCGAFPLDCGNLTASQLTLSNGGNSTILTTTSTGLNINDPIVSTSSITGTQLTLSSGGNSSVLTTTANGLSVNDDISGTSLTTTGILTAGSLKILSPSNDTLTLQSLTNFGLLPYCRYSWY